MILPLGAKRGLISPMGVSVQRADTSWWLTGGIPAANCIAAYRAEGASSYATSKVNLANPGTYNLTPSTYMSWESMTGWWFVATLPKYFSTGITPANDQSWSMIIKFSGATVNGETIAGSENTSGNGRFYLWARRGAADDRLYGNGGYLAAGVRVQDGIIALAGAKCYYNKSLDGTISTAWNVGAREIIIGGSNAAAGTTGITPVSYFTGYVQAIAIYDIDISSYIDVLTDAIDALVGYDNGLRGIWSWYTQPNAVYYNGNLYFSVIDTIAQKLNIYSYNISTEALTSANLATWYGVDDHSTASILVRDSDKKLLAFSAKHNDSTIRLRISSNTESISAWDSEVSLDASLGGTMYNYPNPIQLLGEANDPIYLIYTERGDGIKGQYYSKSEDGGATWAAGTKFFQYTDGESVEHRPYFQSVQNGIDRIDFACTQGHPSEVAGCSIYHFYYTGGKWYKSDGTEITEALPLEPGDVTRVYDGSTTEAWIWDITIDSSGYPVLVYATFPTPASDHRYNYARWTGSAWDIHEICTAGSPLYSAETYYSGGVTIDKTDPSIVWCSRYVDSKWAIWKYTTSDSGATWSGTIQTTATTNPQARPYCAKDYDGDALWWYGTYTSYIDSDCQIRYE